MLRTAFIEAIDDIRSNIVLRRVVERLERGDVNGAIAAMNLDEAAFRPLEEAIRQAYNGGDVATVEQMPALRDPSGFQVVLRWDARNLTAETWLREHSAQLVTNIVADPVGRCSDQPAPHFVRRGVLRSGEPKRSRLFGRAISASIVSDSGALNSQRCNHCLVFAFSRLQSWRATKMPTFIPITIYLNHKPIVVASIPEAANALQQPWPFMDKPSRLEAIRMIEECLAGHCTQQAAFDAFKAAASEQGLLKRKPPSAGLRKFDGVAEDIL
ncbi:MAG: DUF982 domain-containing protein [Mesorhizobium sp.]|nr:MAG: DUF982 domain-containing protein [Mesorhizobium sp.]